LTIPKIFPIQGPTSPLINLSTYLSDSQTETVTHILIERDI